MSTKKTEILACTRSFLSENMFHLDGKPFSLGDYPFYKTIYNGQWPRMLLMCGRQIAKSTTGQNLILSESIAIPYYKTLYVAPTEKQASVFSVSRLGKTITGSPAVRDHFTSSDDQLARWRMSFTNGSEINIGYASDNPDRIRGISADRVVYDEIQDIIYHAVVPVVDETLSNSEHGYASYMGTPKSMENTIQYLWDLSSQDEWIMKCTGCNKWNYVINADSIGKFGIICMKCGKRLAPRSGRWYSMNPEGTIKGFHIPQLILPRNNESDARWSRILYKYENTPESAFKNEVLGVSDAIGTRMVGQEDLENLCRDYFISEEPHPSVWDDVLYTVAGIDWSGGGSSTYTSRTVLWIWGRLPDGKLKTMYFKIYPTSNPVADVRSIIDACRRYNCQFVVGDAGVGATANAMLMEALGRHRVVQAQYGSNSQLCKWNGKDRYMVDKTAAIDTVMLQYLREGFVFPNQKQMREPIADILAAFEEVTQQGAGKKIWNCSPSVPDDSLHAQVFGWLAGEIASHKIQFYPTAA